MCILYRLTLPQTHTHTHSIKLISPATCAHGPSTEHEMWFRTCISAMSRFLSFCTLSSAMTTHFYERGWNDRLKHIYSVGGTTWERLHACIPPVAFSACVWAMLTDQNAISYARCRGRWTTRTRISCLAPHASLASTMNLLRYFERDFAKLLSHFQFVQRKSAISNKFLV